MSETLLDVLTAAVAEFEQTLEATRASRRDHVGASTDLRAVASEITKQVPLLDGLVRYRFGGNAELMGAWANARTRALKGRLGPKRALKGSGYAAVQIHAFWRASQANSAVRPEISSGSRARSTAFALKRDSPSIT